MSFIWVRTFVRPLTWHSTPFELRTFSPHSKFIKCFERFLWNANSWENACSTSNFIRVKRTAAKSNNEKVQTSHIIPGNDAAGPQLPIYAVSVMQYIFGSVHLFGTMQLALTGGFHGPIKCHSNLHSKEFISWNLHSTNSNFDVLCSITGENSVTCFCNGPRSTTVHQAADVLVRQQSPGGVELSAVRLFDASLVKCSLHANIVIWSITHYSTLCFLFYFCYYYYCRYCC